MLEPLMPEPSWFKDRPRKHSWQEILNGIFYITRSDCPWRMMLSGLPHWKATTLGCGEKVVFLSDCTPPYGRKRASRWDTTPTRLPRVRIAKAWRPVKKGV